MTDSSIFKDLEPQEKQIGGKHYKNFHIQPYEFISKNTLKDPVEKTCQCMQVSKNAYYYWINSKEKLEVITSKSILKNRITCLFKESKEVYGSYRIQKQLEREGFFYCRSYLYSSINERNGVEKCFKAKVCYYN